jgi:antitoxin VapB
MYVAKIFKIGSSQIVRLPKEFCFEGDAVLIRRVGNAVVLFPKSHPWNTLVQSLEMFSDDFLRSRKQPEQRREEF